MAEAKELLKVTKDAEHSYPVVAVFCKFNLSDQSVVKLLEQHEPHQRVVVYSSLGLSYVESFVVAKGATAYVPLPFESGRLEQVFRQLNLI